MTGNLLLAYYGGGDRLESRTLEGSFGATTGNAILTFEMESGSLAPFYAASGGIGTNIGFPFNISPAFSATTFANNFDGHIAGTIGPAIPEPSNLTGGVGTLCLLGYAW